MSCLSTYKPILVKAIASKLVSNITYNDNFDEFAKKFNDFCILNEVTKLPIQEKFYNILYSSDKKALSSIATMITVDNKEQIKKFYATLYLYINGTNPQGHFIRIVKRVLNDLSQESLCAIYGKLFGSGSGTGSQEIYLMDHHKLPDDLKRKIYYSGEPLTEDDIKRLRLLNPNTKKTSTTSTSTRSFGIKRRSYRKFGKKRFSKKKRA